MPVSKIRRLGVGILAAAVLGAGGALAAPPAPASAMSFCGFANSSYQEKVRYGSRGQAVMYLQCILRDVGYGVTVDGVFGRHTLNSVKDWQGRRGLDIDGVVGPITWHSLRVGSSRY